MRKIQTALLAFGMSGRVFHAPFIHAHEGFALAGAWERTQKKIQDFYPDTHSFSTLTEILDDETIELVVVNTPTHTHYDLAKQCLLAGKHIIVEKAFTTSIEEARELKFLAEKYKKKIAVYQNRRWDSDFLTVKKIKESNILGELVEAEFRFDRFKPSLSPKTHKETKNPGAGLLMDLGPHLIDQAIFLFGMPVSIFADIKIVRAHSAVDDNFEIILYYPAMRVTLKSSYFVREPVPSFILHGRAGSFLKKRADTQEDFLLAGNTPGAEDYGKENKADGGLLHTEKNGHVIKEHIAAVQGNYMNFYKIMYEAITEDKAEPVTAADGINVMRIIDAAKRSNSERRIIDLNSETGQTI